MGNIGSGELLVILILGLLVLGPSRLGVVVQQVGRVVGQVRRGAGGFQEELRDLVEDPSIEALARERGRKVTDAPAEDELTEDELTEDELTEDELTEDGPAEGGSSEDGSAEDGSL